MTPRQKKFCLEYASTGNATQSAISAGYKEKTAYSQGQRLLSIPSIQNMLEELAEEYSSSKIASAREVQEKLTAIIRGETLEEVIVIEGVGGGVTKAVKMTKRPSTKDIIRAIETLGKMQGLFNDGITLDVVIPVFSGENALED